MKGSNLPSGSRTEHIEIPLSGIDIGERERSYLAAALEEGWISGTGPYVKRFEERVSEQVRRKHTVAVANGTLAIELVLRCIEIGPGDEVIVPALTFAAPAMSILAVGATPVVADVDPDTWTLSPSAAAAAVTSSTRAIIGVDVLGHPADHDALTALGLPVIEDAAEAHGALYKERPTGSLGIASVFSFHANKAITTGEGGCVCTDSDELAERMRVMAHHGIRPQQPYVCDGLGRNFRMTNLTASIGLGQLDRWDELVAARNRVAARYEELLEDAACASRPIAPWATYACWLHTVTVDKRPRVLEKLRNQGIDSRGIWPPLSDQPLLRDPREYPVARDLAARALWLPTSAVLTDREMSIVAASLVEAIKDTAEE